MKSFYKESDPNPHLHIHVRSRYAKQVMLNGNTYTDAEHESPYDGAKAMLLVDRVDDKAFLRMLTEAICADLPDEKSIKHGGNKR